MKNKIRPDTASSKRVLQKTGEIIEACGPRITGTDACDKSAGMLKGFYQKGCDHVFTEKFATHPTSFLSFMKYYAVTYVLALALLYLGGSVVHIAALLLLVGLLLSLSQLVFYKEYFDPFHPKKSATNLYGTIEPEGELRQQVIISGHHDSAFEFSFLASRFQKYYAIRIILGVLCYVVLCGAALAWSFIQLKTGRPPEFARAVIWLGLLGLVFVLPFYRFLNGKLSPGAGDNLVASVIAGELANIFGEAKKSGNSPLQHTRIIAASFDAEECGLRGSREFVKRHRTELSDLPTFVFNIDSIYQLSELKFLTSDLNGFTRLSKTMALQCQEIASTLDYKASLAPMVFGGGATDAAEFAAEGIPATTLLAMSTKHVREDLTYHTRRDTVDCIEPEAVSACMDICYHYILLKDQDAS